jgi:concanavalin A-like lectin/glucanase superfamily protein
MKAVIAPVIPHTLLLHFDGGNGGTTTTEVNGRTVTRSAAGGSADATLSTAQVKFGTASSIRNGNGGWTVANRLTNEDFGTGDFTLEAWVYMTTGSKLNLIIGTVDTGGGSNGIQFFVNTDNKLRLLCYSGASLAVDLSTTTTCPTNQWVYAYAQRKGNVFSISLDCAGTNTTTVSTNITTGTQPGTCIGHDQTNTTARDFNGHLDEVGITKGTARDITVVPTSAWTA